MRFYKYYVSVYPDNLGNGEYDGRGTYAIKMERYNNNRCYLAWHTKAICDDPNLKFGTYPIIVEIRTAANKPVERWRKDREYGQWQRIYDDRITQ